MQETWIRSLAQEDPTCHREAKPMCHNYEAPVRSRAPKPQLLKPTHSRAHTLQQEKPLGEMMHSVIYNTNGVLKVFEKSYGKEIYYT